MHPFDVNEVSSMDARELWSQQERDLFCLVNIVTYQSNEDLEEFKQNTDMKRLQDFTTYLIGARYIALTEYGVPDAKGNHNASSAIHR